MPGKDATKLSKRTVDTLCVQSKEAVFWDRDLPGFGVRVYTTGRKVYVVQSRGPDGPKRVTIGRHGKISAEQARKDAAVLIDRIKRGEPPVPPPPVPAWTVSALAERYMEAHVAVSCRPATIKIYRAVVTKYILPELGELPIDAVDRAHVSALHCALRDKPYQANRAVEVLSKMLSLAEAWGLTPPRQNPCRSVRKYQERRRERFLTAEEYRRLGRVLDAAEADGSAWPSAIAALRLLLLTGCRRGEVVTLRWDDVDRTAGELRLRDSKTGARRVPLTPAVEAVLDGIPRIAGNPWVIVGQKPAAHLLSLHPIWIRLRARAGLEDVRIHDLRHSYASRALALGEGLPMIGKLLGHTKVTTTARYAHLARDTEKISAAKVGGSRVNLRGHAYLVTSPIQLKRRTPEWETTGEKPIMDANQNVVVLPATPLKPHAPGLPQTSAQTF